MSGMTVVRSSGTARRRIPLSRRYAAALDLVGDATSARSRRELGDLVLSGMAQVVRGDEVSLVEVRLDRRRVLRSMAGPTAMRELPQPAGLWLSRPIEHPYFVHYLRHRDPRVARLSEVVTPVELRRSVYYPLFFRARDIAYAGYVTIVAEPRRSVVVAVNRHATELNDDDCDLLERMRRPLGAVWRRLEERERTAWPPAPRPIGECSVTGWPTDPLTAAERRVVELVVTGMANRDVAAVLGISTKAVEQHLTHVYRRLALHSRTELVARWHTGVVD